LPRAAFGLRCEPVNRDHSNSLAEAADDEIVTVGAIQPEDAHNGRTFCGIDNLPNAQKGLAFWNRKKFCGSRVCRGSIDFFVGVAEFDVEVPLQDVEERFALQRRGQQPGEVRS